MKIETHLSDDLLLSQLGARLARLRLDKNLTQQQLAMQAGLGLRTVQRLELGAAATQLSGFLRVCRVLGLVEGLNTFIPEPPPSPLAQLKLLGRQRKRAASTSPALTTNSAGAWQWGTITEGAT
jgi:transcriptional regulator with XRE-family HTH domain